jgi:hypothetical protein
MVGAQEVVDFCHIRPIPTTLMSAADGGERGIGPSAYFE